MKGRAAERSARARIEHLTLCTSLEALRMPIGVRIHEVVMLTSRRGVDLAIVEEDVGASLTCRAASGTLPRSAASPTELPVGRDVDQPAAHVHRPHIIS